MTLACVPSLIWTARWLATLSTSGLLKPFLMFDHPHPGETNYHRDAVVFRDAKPAYRLTLAGSDAFFFAGLRVAALYPDECKKSWVGND